MCIRDSVQLNPGSFLTRQLRSAVVSTKDRIVIDGIIITIVLGVEPNPEGRVFGSEWLDQAAFEIMNFCKFEAGHLCWIYPRDWLLPLPNVDRTTLLCQGNLYRVPGDDEVVQPVPYQLAPYSSQASPSSFS